LPKLKEFPENVRCSNINGAMHKLLVGECLMGAKRKKISEMRSICLLYDWQQM